MFNWQWQPEEQRVVELADGRVLLLPRGRGGPAYEVTDHLAGWRFEQRLTWVERAAGAGLIVLLGAAAVLEDWRPIILLLPLGAAKLLADRVILSGLREATDLSARSEANRVEEVSALAVAAVVGMSLLSVFFLWVRGGGRSSLDVIETAIVILAGGFAVARVVRQRRASAERKRYDSPSPPENRPVVPR